MNLHQFAEKKKKKKETAQRMIPDYYCNSRASIGFPHEIDRVQVRQVVGGLGKEQKPESNEFVK
jgi:hypothetical protein